MADSYPPKQYEGLSLGQAALVAGLGLLVVTITAPFAQFYVFPGLLAPGDVAQTVQNLAENRGLFLAGIMAYLVNYTFDIIVAWALYVLLAPVNRSLSLLAFVVCLIYIAVALTAVMNYVEVFRLLGSPEIASALGSEQLNAQVYVLFNSYQYDWGFSLIIFGIVLLLRGFLVFRSHHIPSIFGVLLAIAGIGYIVYLLGLYIAPDVNLGFLAVTFLAEPVFMLWLLIKGWRIPDAGEPAETFGTA
jgi:hypothetical protein